MKFKSIIPSLMLSLLLIAPISFAGTDTKLTLTNSLTNQTLEILWRNKSLNDSVMNTVIEIGDLCLTTSGQKTCNTSPMTDTQSSGVGTNHNGTELRWYGDDGGMMPTFFSWGAFPEGQSISDFSTVTFSDLGNIDMNYSTYLQVGFSNASDYIGDSQNSGSLNVWQLSVVEVSSETAPVDEGTKLTLTNSLTNQTLEILWRNKSLNDSVMNTVIEIGDLCLTTSGQKTCNTSPMTDTQSSGVGTNHNGTELRWYGDDGGMMPTFFSWGAFPEGQSISDFSTVTFSDLGNIDMNYSTYLQVGFSNASDYIGDSQNSGSLNVWQLSVVEVSNETAPVDEGTKLTLTNSLTNQTLEILWRNKSLSDSVMNTVIEIGDLCLTTSGQKTCNTSPMTDTQSSGVGTNHNSTTLSWYGNDDGMMPTFFSWGGFPIGQPISDWSTVTFSDLGNIDMNYSTHLQVGFSDAGDYINDYQSSGSLDVWQLSIAEDNCPSIPNADQANLDGDAFGDACDLDIDGDGYANVFEIRFGGDETDNTDAAVSLANAVTFSETAPADSDLDGVPDDYETAAGGDTTSSTFESVLAMLTTNKNVPAMGGIGLLALGLSMLGLGAIRMRK